MLKIKYSMKLRGLFVVLIHCFSTNQAWALTKASTYIEDVLKSSLQFEAIENHLDPLALPDFKTYFQDYVTLIGAVKGSVDYTNGELEGLSKVERTSNCSGPFYSVNAAVISCNISLDHLRISYKGKLKYGKMPPVAIDAKANLTKTVLYIDVISYFQNLTPMLRSFRFVQIGSVSTKISGLGVLFNKYLGALDPRFRQQVWAVCFNSLGQDFQFALSRAVSRVPLALP